MESLIKAVKWFVRGWFQVLGFCLLIIFGIGLLHLFIAFPLQFLYGAVVLFIIYLAFAVIFD